MIERPGGCVRCQRCRVRVYRRKATGVSALWRLDRYRVLQPTGCVPWACCRATLYRRQMPFVIAQTFRLFRCRHSLFRRRCLLVSSSRTRCAARAECSLVVERGQWPTTKRGRSPLPSRLPNGKSKLGRLNTSRWLHESAGNWPDHWPCRLSGSTLSRTTSYRRNERNLTGTFPRSNSCRWCCFFDCQPRCSSPPPWEPSGEVPFI